MAIDIDNPWDIDDFQRRVFQHLFSDRVDEREQSLRRMRRRCVVAILEGVLQDRVSQVREASCMLIDLTPDPKPPLSDHVTAGGTAGDVAPPMFGTVSQ